MGTFTWPPAHQSAAVAFPLFSKELDHSVCTRMTADDCHLIKSAAESDPDLGSIMPRMIVFAIAYTDNAIC